MLTLILVPLDGSGFGEQALPMAQRLAEREGAVLELVHIGEALAPYRGRRMPARDERHRQRGPTGITAVHAAEVRPVHDREALDHGVPGRRAWPGRPRVAGRRPWRGPS